MKNFYSKRSTCRLCDESNLELVLHLKPTPIADHYVTIDQQHITQEIYPLDLYLCESCGHVQLLDVIDPEILFREYSYVTSVSPGLVRHFQEHANQLIERLSLSPRDLVVEIGSNDGILLNLLKDNYRILGVDPATNVVLRALKRGMPTLPLFFSESIAEKIVKEWGTAKVIIGNNCIAHLNDLRDLMNGINLLLSSDGVFVVECNYWGGMVKNTNYSLIYHDHYSYFSLKVWQQFLEHYGMKVFDAIVTPAQGGSLRMFICKDRRAKMSRIKILEKEERDNRLNTEETCLKYKENVF